MWKIDSQLSSKRLKVRTLTNFGVLIAASIVFVLAWNWLSHQSELDGIPGHRRHFLELNGKIWKGLFRPSSKSVCRPPPPGTLPRVNGDIGLGEDFDPDKWQLEVTAPDVNTTPSASSRRLVLTMKDIKALPRTETSTDFKCIEGWSEDMSFAGVKFSDFMKAYNIAQRPYVGLATVDGQYYVSIDMESMLHEQTLLAYEMNGAPLRDENGAPLRLVIPVKYGIKNIKRIGKISFSDQRPPDYWEEQGYDWYAGL